VIGAGIHGAGVAQAAAAAGYQTVVLEQSGVASATSSCSSKLIHGGLRYLESAQFGLVRKSLRERDCLLRNAPHLVQLKNFYLPVYRQTRRRPLTIALGLMLYALLGGLRANTRFNVVRKRDWSALPIKQQGLQFVFKYQDAQTDDAVLTQAVMTSAQQLGAQLHCPAEFLAAHKTAQGWRVDYRQAQQTHILHSRVIVNASGAWVNRVLPRIDARAQGIAVDLVQGVHVLLNNPAPDGIYYVEAPQDQRAVFIMPWQGKMLVGTTESHFHGEVEQVAPLESEIDYLLQVVRHYMPNSSIEVLQSMVGIRVLPQQAGSHFHRSRDMVLHMEPEGVLTLYGGKLTSYRATAESAMQKLQAYLPAARSLACTESLSLR